MKCKAAKKDILITKCCCMFCKNCLKSCLLEANKNLFTTTFETKKTKEAMCTCPIHNWRIDSIQIQAVFAPEELEQYAVDAMRRELRDGEKRRNMRPNICIECKKLLMDQGRYCKNLCYRHKVCKDCPMYSLYSLNSKNQKEPKKAINSCVFCIKNKRNT